VPLPDPQSAAGASGELYVHVLGAVEHPGLYVLDLDARLVDALAAAGGTTDDADLASVNLARLLADGEQIVVPVVGAAQNQPGAAAPADDLIDLNTADQTALESLPRIGPALAERIIAWREENGRFQSVDDLLAVPGIGEKLLEAIRDGARV
jgi:competence protein ComEA